MTDQLNEKFLQLEDAVTNEILERQEEAHTAVLAIVSKKHHFQIGPPGTGKSILVDRIMRRIDGLGDFGYFRWLLTRHTTPEELFGGPDFNLLKEKGIYKRITEYKMPEAFFVFYDEIFKGNSSILNANLTAINERLFFNPGDDPNIPLISLFSASNEMPHGEELWALWDRLTLRHEISNLQESSNFIKMISTPIVETPKKVIDLNDIYSAHEIVSEVKITDEILEAMKGLRDNLRQQGIEPTERRWVESMAIIKGEAFLNGRDSADIEDMRPLMHVLWADLDHQKEVQRTVLEISNPVDREAGELLDRLIGLEKNFEKNLADCDGPKSKAKIAVDVYKRLQKATKQVKALDHDVEILGKESKVLNDVKAKIDKIGFRIYEEGFKPHKDGDMSIGNPD